jgi:hypothetical protein
MITAMASSSPPLTTSTEEEEGEVLVEVEALGTDRRWRKE